MHTMQKKKKKEKKEPIPISCGKKKTHFLKIPKQRKTRNIYHQSQAGVAKLKSIQRQRETKLFERQWFRNWG